MTKINTPKLRFKEFTDEWQEKKLCDVLLCIVDNRGKTPGLSSRGIPLIEVNAMGAKKVDYFGINKYVSDETYEKWFRKHISEGDVLFSTVGKTAVCSTYSGDKKAAIAQNIVGLRANHQNSANFLYYLLIEPSNNNKFKKIEMTAVQPSVKVSQMIHLKFNLPQKPEQQKIADFLGAVDEKIEKLEEKKKAFEKYKKGIMQAIFSQMIRFKKPDGSNFPDWEEKKLGEIGEFYRGHSYTAANVKVEGFLVLRSNNIQGNKLIINRDLQFVNKPFGKQIALRKDDIAICMANGSKQLVGKSAVYDGDYNGPATVGAFCSIYRSKCLLAKYLFELSKYDREIELLLSGTNINNLKNSDLASIGFKLPTSFEEQEKIAEFLFTLDNKINLINSLLEQTKLFKKSLLQRMFV